MGQKTLSWKSFAEIGALLVSDIAVLFKFEIVGVNIRILTA